MLNRISVLLTIALCLALFACAEKSEDSQADKMDQQETEAVVTYASWNKVCPVMGEEVDQTVPTVKYNDKDYGFCCSGCEGKFAEAPEKYAANLNEEGSEFIAEKM